MKECPKCQRKTNAKHTYCFDCGTKLEQIDDHVAKYARLEKIKKLVDDYCLAQPDLMADKIFNLVRTGESHSEYQARIMDHYKELFIDRRNGSENTNYKNYVERDIAFHYPWGGISREAKYIKWMLEIGDDRLKGTILYDRRSLSQ